jgi:hypothetical protein
LVPLSIKWRGGHPEGISLDPEIFGIEGHPEGETKGEVTRSGGGERNRELLTELNMPP